MIGKILGGRYELLEEVGRGGMAIVYKAKCLLLNRIVAVKVLRTDLEETQEFLKRFNTEAQAAASISSQNIASVYDVGEENGIHYIVMEFIEGVTLKEYIRRTRILPWEESVKIAIEICKGISCAHSNGIIHRDIKPQNIIVTNTGAIKVTDFGIARAATASTLTADNDVLGSVYYFSPEQARGGFVDKKTDIYSLGVVLYEMLTGKVPYDGDSPVAIAMKHIERTPDSIVDAISSVPKSVEDVVFKAMEKDTLKRYQTIDEMESDLQRIISDPGYAVQNDVEDDMSKTKKIAAIKNVSNTSSNAEKSGDKKAIILAIITSLIVVAILSVAAVSFLNIGGFGNEKILVPSLVGMSIDEAENLAEQNGFIVEIQDYEESDKAEDTVLEQKPKAKQVVTKEGTVIKVVISKKKSEETKLEDYKNKDAQLIKEELEELGIKVEIVLEENEDIEEGFVIKQSPKAGKTVALGDTVTLYVSGSEDKEKQVPVPNLVGKTEADAKKLLSEAGLELGEVTHVNSDKEKDTIVSQGLTGFVNEGTKINIVLSSGKEESNDNGDHGSQQKPVTDTPNTTTPTKTSKTLSVDLSQYTSTVKIDIISNGRTVYSATHNPVENPMFSATLMGSGTESFDIYINGSKVGSRAINFDS